MIEYKSGQCNIGTEEVRVRYIMCIMALMASAASVFMIHWYKSYIALYVVAYFAFSTAVLTGLQAIKKFCVKHALSGNFNFNAFGKSEKVCNVDDRKRDIQKARAMIVLSYTIGLLFLIGIFFLCDYHKL
jgi:hypothetical protein